MFGIEATYEFNGTEGESEGEISLSEGTIEGKLVDTDVNGNHKHEVEGQVIREEGKIIGIELLKTPESPLKESVEWYLEADSPSNDIVGEYSGKWTISGNNTGLVQQKGYSPETGLSTFMEEIEGGSLDASIYELEA